MRVLLCALVLAAASAAVAQEPPAPAPAAVKPLYVVTYREGPQWLQGQPMHKQKLAGHVRYIQSLIAQGRLVAGGPFTGAHGGMAILRAASAAEAQAILTADPAILNGTFLAEIRSWEPVIDSGEPLVRRP